MEVDRTYCWKNCKGFNDTHGRCFCDGVCESYKAANKDTK